MVYTPVGSEEIYVLHSTVDAQKRITTCRGETLITLGAGIVY